MNIRYDHTTFKDYEDITGLDLFQRASAHQGYLNHLRNNGFLNYRLEVISGCGPEVELNFKRSAESRSYVSFVSNDYLGFTQHPKVKKAVTDSINKYGTGAGSSPLIGGYYTYHKDVESKLCSFFKRPAGSALVYTTGYTSNSASLLSLLKKEDIAIVDMAVHASVYEGINGTATKRFPHNHVDALERILRNTKDHYRTRMVIIDGVYSQDGDLALLDQIVEVTHKFGGVLMVDDAHGIGVIGETGRGALEYFGLLERADIITGTFSKTFAGVGGYVIAHPDIISYLQFQSRQYAFSAAATPAIAGISRAIDLIDEEPAWQLKLWENIRYYRKGLLELGLNIGNTASAIIPVKIGDVRKTCEAGRLLLENGIYTNPIMYPAVSVKDARIRMSIMATHNKAHLDKALNVFEYVSEKLDLVGSSDKDG